MVRGKVYMAKKALAYERMILRGIYLKVKYPLWHDMDELIARKVEALQFLKKYWR